MPSRESTVCASVKLSTSAMQRPNWRPAYIYGTLQGVLELREAMRRFIYASCLGVALLACETTTLNGDSARGMSPFDSSSSREDALDIAPPVTNLEFFASSLGCRTDEIEFEFKSPEAKPKFVEIRCRGSAEPLTKCTADVASCENLEGSRQPSWGLSEDDRGGRGAEAQPSARRSARPGPEKEPETNTAAVSPPGAENPSASAPAIGDVPQDPVANSPEDNARLGVDSGGAAGRSTAAESTIAIDENSAAPHIQSDHAAVEDPTLRKNRSERHVASESTLGKVETVTQDPGKVRGEVPTQPPERPEDEDSPFLGDWLLDDWGDGNDRDHSNRQ